MQKKMLWVKYNQYISIEVYFFSAPLSFKTIKVYVNL